eukprot:scaffold79882_cov48-Phaeocystis_antarctica.AAC.1
MLLLLPPPLQRLRLRLNLAPRRRRRLLALLPLPPQPLRLHELLLRPAPPAAARALERRQAGRHAAERPQARGARPRRGLRRGGRGGRGGPHGIARCGGEEGGGAGTGGRHHAAGRDLSSEAGQLRADQLHQQRRVTLGEPCRGGDLASLQSLRPAGDLGLGGREGAVAVVEPQELLDQAEGDLGSRVQAGLLLELRHRDLHRAEDLSPQLRTDHSEPSRRVERLLDRGGELCYVRIDRHGDPAFRRLDSG